MDNSEVHEGENIRLVRTVSRLNQKELAVRMGSKWSQQKVAYWEKQPKIKTVFLFQFAAAMNVQENIFREKCQELSQALMQPAIKAVQANNHVVHIQRKINELYHRLLKSEIELYLLCVEESKNSKQ